MIVDIVNILLQKSNVKILKVMYELQPPNPRGKFLSKNHFVEIHNKHLSESICSAGINS